MLAFEELKKQLEEQHAQQLSLLIAEQEREQERLQKVRGNNKMPKGRSWPWPEQPVDVSASLNCIQSNYKSESSVGVGRASIPNEQVYLQVFLHYISVLTFLL